MTQETLAAEGRQEVEPAAESAPAGGVVAAPSAPLNGSENDGLPSGVPEQQTAPTVHFPVATLEEGLPHLRRPFTPEAVRFKVQTVFKEASGCIIVGYIDARLATERLNYVMGANWQDEYEALPDGLLLCRLSVDGVIRQDVGSGYKGKGLYSDALKRAAVKFGVGQSIYAIPQITLFEREAGKGEGKSHLIEKFTGTKGPSLRLTDKGIAALRKGYGKWLEETGIPNFGQPIDHGDVEDSAGEEPQAVAANDDVTDLPAVKMPLTDEKAYVLQGTCRAIYDQIDGRRLPKARFESELRQASVSHDELEAFAQKLRGMAS